MGHLGWTIVAVLGLAPACLDEGGSGGGDGRPGLGSGPDSGGDQDARPSPSQTDAGGGDVTEPPVDAGRPEDAAAPLEACEPALQLSPAETVVLPLDLRTFVGTGGTGAYRFSLEGDESGAILHPLTGAYLAGEILGTTDRILLTDEGCVGEATATAEIVPPMEVLPEAVELPPDGSFTFRVTGGSGALAFGIADPGSGGTVDEVGHYRADGLLGRDVVRVADTRTGETIDVPVDVVDGARLVPAPARMGLPVGARMRPIIVGGSGHFEAEVVGDGITFEEGEIRALAPGKARLDLRDVFTGMTATLHAAALAPHHVELERAGDLSLTGTVLPAGDLDGDGHDDAVLALPEADISGHNSGVVLVYRGGADGPDPAPAMVIAGANRRDELGRGIDVADVDNDGLQDLIVGAIRADPGGVDRGAVYIHPGIEGGLFAAEPARVLAGAQNYDYFGWSLAACDFNGDGRQDLAVGAYLGEDRDADPVMTDQGAVAVFLGHEDGFLDEPDQIVWGVDLDESGEWIPRPALHLGWKLDAGDVDGDGFCDLVAVVLHHSAGRAGGLDGAVLVYRGRPAVGADAGGVAPLPSRAHGGGQPGDRGAQFGRFIAVGDLNGDGMAEVAAAQFAHDNDPSRNVNQGAARVLLGGPMGDGPARELLPASGSAWIHEGAVPWDHAGWNVAIGDADGDGRPDLLVGDVRSEPEGGVTNAGAVAVFPGLEGELPDTTPARVVGGGTANDWFGQALAPVGDMDGDDQVDLLVFAGRVDQLGLEVGLPYLIPGDPDRDPVPLELPGEAAGAGVGQAVAVVGDLDGDGLAELAIGIPLRETAAHGHINAGAVSIHKGTPSGFESEPSSVLSAFHGNSIGDHYGQAVAGAGDFDGDGVHDLAVTAPHDDRPGAFTEDYSHDGSCEGYVGNSGALFVHLGQHGALPEARPSFVLYGPSANALIWALAGDIDVNGDGWADVLIGADQWDHPGRANAGGFLLVHGRPAGPRGLTTVICEADFAYAGLARNDRMARSVTGLGDLDGDGCDEFAVGTFNESPGGRLRRGTVRVVFGWGGRRCPDAPTYVTLIPERNYVYAGWAVAGGHDVDGDGVADLAVGSRNYVADGNSVGAVWLVLGAYLRALPRELLLPGAPPNAYHPLTSGEGGSYVIVGTTPGGLFGSAVAMAAPVGGSSTGLLAVGAPLSDRSGIPLAGAVRVHRVGPDGIEASPFAILGGETGRPGGLLGHAVALGELETPHVIAGAPDGSGLALDSGAVYSMELGE